MDGFFILVYLKMQTTKPSDLKSAFLLDPKITYLNFASFGACPKPIFADYQKWQLELDFECELAI